MSSVVVRRLLTAIPTILLTTVIVFLLRYLLPGGPVQNALGGSGGAGVVTEDALEALKQRYGLDKPAVTQYFDWLGGVLHGDLGRSYYSQEQVTTILGQRVGPSLVLILGALFVSLVVGGGVGMYCAIRRDTTGGRLLLASTGLGVAIPDFWLAAIASGFFGLYLGIFPAVGYRPLSDGLWPHVHSVILPILVLSVVTGAFIARHLYSSMAHVLSQPYARTAWAIGLSPRTVYFNWALRNAVAPVITFLPLAFAALIAATVLVEFVFNIPGLGTVIIESVLNQDYPVVQAVVLLIGVMVAVLNLLADIALAFLDPRLRRGAR